MKTVRIAAPKKNGDLDNRKKAEGKINARPLKAGARVNKWSARKEICSGCRGTVLRLRETRGRRLATTRGENLGLEEGYPIGEKRPAKGNLGQEGGGVYGGSGWVMDRTSCIT